LPGKRIAGQFLHEKGIVPEFISNCQNTIYQTMQRELSTQVRTSIIDEFNKLEAENRKIEDRVTSDVLLKINNHRQQGLLLMDYKDGVARGEWLSSFQSDHGKRNASVTFHCDYNTGRRYIQIAKRYPDTITNPREGLIAMSELWDHAVRQLGNGHGPQTLHENNFFMLVSQRLNSFRDLWEKQMQANPVSQWSRETAEQFVDEMTPHVERINSIYQQARAIAEA